MRVRTITERNSATAPEIFVVCVERFISITESHPRDMTMLMTQHIRQAWEDGSIWRKFMLSHGPNAFDENVAVAYCGTRVFIRGVCCLCVVLMNGVCIWFALFI